MNLKTDIPFPISFLQLLIFLEPSFVIKYATIFKEETLIKKKHSYLLKSYLPSSNLVKKEHKKIQPNKSKNQRELSTIHLSLYCHIQCPPKIRLHPLTSIMCRNF